MRQLLFVSLITLPLVAQSQMPAGTSSPMEQSELQRQLQQAEDNLRDHQFDTARTTLLEIIHADAKNARAQYDLGYTEEQLNHEDDAEAAYRQAIEANPKQFESRFALGMLLARKNDLDGARDQLATAVTLSPMVAGDDAKASAYRALAQIDLGKHDTEAAQELAQAIKLSSETPEDRQLAAQIASSSGDATDAETAFRTVLKNNPGDPEASAGLAKSLLQQKKTDEAESVLTQAMEKHPDNASLAAQLATVYLSEQKQDEAQVLLEKTVAAHPQEPSLQRMLAHLYDQSDSPSKAAPLYEALLQQSPKDVDLLDDYGTCLVKLQRMPEAEKVLQQAVQMPAAFSSKEALAAAASHLAFAASANRDSQTVLQALQIRDGILPPSASSLFLAATAHDRLHDTKVAVDLYHQFLKAAEGKFPNEEWEAKHRLLALEHAR